MSHKVAPGVYAMAKSPRHRKTQNPMVCNGKSPQKQKETNPYRLPHLTWPSKAITTIIQHPYDTRPVWLLSSMQSEVDPAACCCPANCYASVEECFYMASSSHRQFGFKSIPASHHNSLDSNTRAEINDHKKLHTSSNQKHNGSGSCAGSSTTTSRAFITNNPHQH
jgi:hypothetical protein